MTQTRSKNMAKLARKGTITREMAEQALRLAREGNTLREVGKVLASRIGRQMPFTEDAVGRAIRKYIRETK